MNVLRFINSKDIANHLKEIGYQFNTLEASWLIYQCRNASLQEKIQAWQEVIDTMPDFRVAKRCNCMEIASWHEFLREYIALNERLVCDLRKQTAQAVYTFTLRCENDGGFGNWEYLYSSYDKCLSAAKEEADDNLSVTEYKICKIWIDQKDKSMTAYYNRNLELTEISASYLDDRESDLQSSSFEGLWFDFPTPFKIGDILHDPKSPEFNFCCGPFVVTSINVDPEKDKRIYDNFSSSGDSSDMNARGYFQNDDGSIYFEVMQNYMDCEYYRGELVGKRRTLKAMSNLLKHNIDEELFACAYHQILMEEYVKDNMPKWYTEKALDLAGLTDLPKTEKGQ
ncbi:MAG: hypothetical protein Q4F00_07215 [bacterium]|nr:hypothetical protein [bacterium]